MVMPSIEPGLDQEMSMPADSHVVKYFRYMDELLAMGAPVYWVLKPGLNYSLPEQQNFICGGVECNNDSLSVKLYTQSRYPEITSLARPASSWIDDYIDWLSIGDCCKYNASTGAFCPSSECASLLRSLCCFSGFLIRSALLQIPRATIVWPVNEASQRMD